MRTSGQSSTTYYRRRSIALNLSTYIFAGILLSPPCMVITTSLVEKGYEAGIWRARLGIKRLHANGLAAPLRQRLGETGDKFHQHALSTNYWRISRRAMTTSSPGINPEHPCNYQVLRNPKLSIPKSVLNLALSLVLVVILHYSAALPLILLQGWQPLDDLF